MGNNYIEQEVKKIVQLEEYPAPKNFAMASAWILANLKGINLKILDLTQKSSLADYFVLASATNLTQASSMASEIVSQLKKYKVQILSKEGLEGTDWMLIDAGDIIIHIFQEYSRDIYDLDGLWREAKMVPIPESFYIAANDQKTEDKPKPDPEDYF